MNCDHPLPALPVNAVQMPSVDVANGMPGSLTPFAFKEWLADPLATRPKERSLAEKTGLVVRVEK